jgi:type IV secretion system protein TrbL
MNDLNVIDQFMQTFITYIDSGFGLLNDDVAFLTTILIGIDITLAGLFWALDGEGFVLIRLIKKVLYVGVFAFILNNFKNLSDIIYNSFAGLGLHASATSLTAADLLKPGKLAGVGFSAAHPLLVQAGSMIGFTNFFNNIGTVLILLLAWALVVLAFFILAVQLFITILEFKLTSLAGFVLVPFALWNKTAFLAERVLGSVITSGIKVMVLAVIVGIGSSFFDQFVNALQGHNPDIGQAMSLVLAALSLLGLGIFGPAIAAGLVTGAPQLGAGAAIGTMGAAAGAAMLGGGAVMGGARLMGAAGSGGLAAIRAGTAMGSAATTAYGLGQASSGTTGMAGVAAGLGGVARAGAGAAAQGARSMMSRAASSLSASGASGRNAAWRATGGTPPKSASAASSSPGTAAGSTSTPAASAAPAANSAPQWAKRLRSEQAARHQRQTTTQAIKEGDRPGAPANPDLSETEE